MPRPLLEVLSSGGRHYALARGLSALAGGLGLLLYTRLLPAEGYGAAVLAATGAYFCAGAVGEWLCLTALRFYEEYFRVGRQAEFLSTAAALLFACCALGLAAGAAVLRTAFPGGLPAPFCGLAAPFLALIAGEASYSLSLVLAQASGRSLDYARRTVFYSFCQIALAAFFIRVLGAGPAGLLWGVALSGGAVALRDVFFLSRRGLLKFSLVNRALAGRLFRYGAPLALLSVCGMALPFLSNALLARLSDARAVGLYAAGCNLAGALVRFPAEILLLAAVPLIMKSFAPGKTRAAAVLLTAFSALLLCALIPWSVTAGLFSAQICALLLGPDYAESRRVFVWILAGGLCQAAAQYAQKPFELAGRTFLPPLILVLSSAAGLFLQWQLIPRFGFEGAAAGVFAGFALNLAAVRLIGARLFFWRFPFGALLRSSAAATAALSVLLLSTVPSGSLFLFLTASAWAFGALYAAGLYVLREPCLLKTLKYLRALLKKNAPTGHAPDPDA